MKSSYNREFLENKLEYIAQYAKRLDEVLSFSIDEVNADFYKLHTLERLVQLIVDEMIDVNTHIIRHSDIKTPNDFQSTFRALAEVQVFPFDFAERIAPTVGLRNRLVHRYEEIKPDLLIQSAKKEKDDFKEYVSYIRTFIGT